MKCLGSKLTFWVTLVAVGLTHTIKAEDTSTSTVSAPDSATFVQPPPPPPPPPDRKDGQGAAAAMAAVGAGVAFASCAMLMAQARNEPDPSMRTLLMTQAMQQCAQGAQNIANAAQNNKGKDQITSEPPKGSIQTQNGQQQAQNGKKDEALPNIGSSERASSADTGTTTSPTVAEQTTPGTVAPESFGNTPSSGGETTGGGSGDAFSASTLSPIKQPTIGFDENAKKENSTPGPSTTFGPGTLSVANTKGLSEADLKKLSLDSIANPSAKRKAKSDPSDIDTVGGGVGSGASGPGGGDSAGFDSTISEMLAKMMGGQPGEAAAAATGELAAVNNGANDEGTPNIFEYATFRVSKLAHKESRLWISTKQKEEERKKNPAFFAKKPEPQRESASAKPAPKGAKKKKGNGTKVAAKTR